MTDSRYALHVGHQYQRLGQAHLGRFSQRSMVAANHNRRLSIVSWLSLLQRRPRQIQLAFIGFWFYSSGAVRIEFDCRLSCTPVPTPPAPFASDSIGVARDPALLRLQRCSRRIQPALSRINVARDPGLPESQRCQRLSGVRDSALLLLQRHSIEFGRRSRSIEGVASSAIHTGFNGRLSWILAFTLPQRRPLRFPSAGRVLMDRLTK